MIAPTLASACWLGYEVITALAKNKWNFLLRFFCGVPIGIVYQAFYVLFLQFYIPWGTKQCIIVNLTFLIFSIFLHKYNSKFYPAFLIKKNVLDIISIGIGMIFIFIRLHMIYFQDGRYTRGAAYSDFSFHTQLASSFAIGCNVNRTSLLGFMTPMSAGSSLAYPILVNFYSAFLVSSCGVSLQMAFRWPTILIGISFVYIMHSLTLKFTSDSFAAALCLPLWAFSGGLGFLEIFDFGLSMPGPKYINYIHEWTLRKNVFWFQSLTHIFHPQRCATYSIPLCYIEILSLLYGIKMFEWEFFVIAAIAVGITPQTQVHAYVSCAIFSISLAITTFPFNKPFRVMVRAVICWALFGICANLIAFPLVFPYFDRTEQKEFFNVKPIWKNREYASPPFAFFKVWWNALGPFFVISIFTGFATANINQIRIYLASLAVFFIGQVVMFQPWELDNCKILQDGWIPIAIGFVSQFFSKLFTQTKSNFIKVSLYLLFISCIASGFINIVTYEGYKATVCSFTDEQSGKWISENTPVNGVFYQSKEQVMAPSASYAGRSLFFGYVGWMTSHGLLNNSRLNAIFSFERGEDPEINEKFNVKYIVVTDGESTSENLDKYENKTYYERIMDIGEYKLFRFIDNDKYKPKGDKEHTKKRKHKKKLYSFSIN